MCRRHINTGAVLHHHLVRIPDAAVLTLPAAADIHFTAALAAGRRDAAALVQQNVLPLHDNFAALTGRIVCLQGTAQVHHTTVAAVQHNVTVLTVHTAGFHHAAHVQHRIHQHIPAVCRQVNLTIPGANQSTVFHQGVNHIPAHLHGSQTAIVQLQRDAFACRQNGLPSRRADGTAVADLICCQYDITTGIRGQRPLVHNLCPGFLPAAEGVATIHEVVVFNVAGRCHKT